MPHHSPSPPHVFVASATALLLVAMSGIAAAQGNSASQLRQFIDQQVGGIQKLMAYHLPEASRQRGLG